MPRRTVPLLPIVTSWALCCAACAETAGLLPLKRRPAQPEKTVDNRLRRDATLLLYAPKKGAELRLRVRGVQIGRYDSEVVAKLAPQTDEDRRIFPGAQVKLRPTREQSQPVGVLRFAAPRRGVIPVHLRTGANAASVTAEGDNAWVVVEASARSPLHVIGRVSALHFFVPRSARSFTVCGRGAGGAENCRIRVFDPAGRCVGSASAAGARSAVVRVAVPAEHRGKVWHFRADRPPQIPGTFEDGYVWLSDDVPPYVSPQPDGLLVPFVAGMVRPPLWTASKGVALDFALNVEPPKRAKLVVTLTAPGRAALVSSAGPGRAAQIAFTPSPPVSTYGLKAELRDGSGGVLATARSTVSVRGSLVYVGPPQPLVRLALIEREGKPPAVAVRRTVSEMPARLSARVRLLRTAVPDPPGRLGAQVVLDKSIADVPAEAVRIEPPGSAAAEAAKFADGHYQWKAVARMGDQLVDVQRVHFLWKRGALFSEVRPPAGGAVPAFDGGDVERGFLGFVPPAADAVAYNTRPGPADVQRPLSVVLARDQYEPATFALWAARDVRGLRLSAAALRHESKDARLGLDVRVARHWPQRISWTTSSYRIIPEMLEPPPADGLDLAIGELRQIWLTVRAPADAPPGEYTAEIAVRAPGGKAWKRTLRATVLPFTLARAKKVHWGLYSDSGRWRKYPDSQVAAELKDVVEHGITTLMCYPLAHSRVGMKDGRLRIDDAAFLRLMRLARGAGLGPPWVMSLQPLNGTVGRLLKGKKLDDPAFKKLFQEIVAHFARRAREAKLGECVWHTIDEPWSADAIRRAVTELGYIKELGLTTFTTAGPVGADLDKVLDVRCYSVGHLLTSPDVLSAQRRITAAAGDRLWWYGSGCYTGQDGNVRENRYLTGLAFWASRAEGNWSWTFLRTKGDALDDFDGQSHREAKDACIVYPSTTGGAPTPTLQWEGIRAGVTDYRYAWTLSRLAGGREEPGAWERRVPVRRRAGTFDAAQMDAVRAEIIERILRRLRETKRPAADD